MSIEKLNTTSKLLTEYQNQQSRINARDSAIEQLRREVRYLRQYGNKDCTAAADDAMAKGSLDESGDDLLETVEALRSISSDWSKVADPQQELRDIRRGDEDLRAELEKTLAELEGWTPLLIAATAGTNPWDDTSAMCQDAAAVAYWIDGIIQDRDQLRAELARLTATNEE